MQAVCPTQGLVDWSTVLTILLLGFLFSIYGFGFGFWIGFVPMMQCQFGLMYQVHLPETQTIDLFVQGRLSSLQWSRQLPHVSWRPSQKLLPIARRDLTGSLA